MISVAQAQADIAALIRALPEEIVPLTEAVGRVMTRPLAALFDQPPAAVSAMDGYAVRALDITPGARLKVIGEVAAGGFFEKNLKPTEAVRIFTGAPVPGGADKILIQEDAHRDGDLITVGEKLDTAAYIRPAAADFSKGEKIALERPLKPADIALLAAMGHAQIPVYKRPDVALIATGDELVSPGETPARGQIVASNIYGLKALFEQAGAYARIMPIAIDTKIALAQTLELAKDADLIVTIGGASVGDRDLVADALSHQGVSMAFHKIAMRPGKPLMAGRGTKAVYIGLPGNPVSAMVCGHIFVVPAIKAFQGLGYRPQQTSSAKITKPLAPNGARTHYMRATWEPTETGAKIAPADKQDSALLSVLASSNALLIRQPNAKALEVGASVEFIKT